MGAAAIFAVIWLHPLFRDFSNLSVVLNSQTFSTEITYHRYLLTQLSTVLRHWPGRLRPL